MYTSFALPTPEQGTYNCLTENHFVSGIIITASKNCPCVLLIDIENAKPNGNCNRLNCNDTSLEII